MWRVARVRFARFAIAGCSDDTGSPMGGSPSARTMLPSRGAVQSRSLNSGPNAARQAIAEAMGSEGPPIVAVEQTAEGACASSG